MNNRLNRVVLSLAFLSTFSYATNWSILNISMGTPKSMLKKKGFECKKILSYCEAYHRSKYASKRKDLFKEINSIKAYIDHENKIYKIEVESDVSFEPIEIEAYKNVFTKIAQKEEGIHLKIEKAIIFGNIPIVALTHGKSKLIFN